MHPMYIREQDHARRQLKERNTLGKGQGEGTWSRHSTLVDPDIDHQCLNKLQARTDCKYHNQVEFRADNTVLMSYQLEMPEKK